MSRKNKFVEPKNSFVDIEGKEIEIVFCRAIDCRSNLGNGKCKIVHGPNGDDKVSHDKEGRCENYFTN